MLDPGTQPCGGVWGAKPSAKMEGLGGAVYATVIYIAKGWYMNRYTDPGLRLYDTNGEVHMGLKTTEITINV